MGAPQSKLNWHRVVSSHTAWCHCTVLSITAPYCPTLHLLSVTAPYCPSLHHTVLTDDNVLSVTALYCPPLHRTVRHCTVLSVTILYCQSPHCTVSHCTILSVTAPYCPSRHCPSRWHCTVRAASLPLASSGHNLTLRHILLATMFKQKQFRNKVSKIQKSQVFFKESRH